MKIKTIAEACYSKKFYYICMRFLAEFNKMLTLNIYFAENQTGNPSFASIPSSFWWAVITFTSVGYGDTYPITTLGKFIGAFTAIMGIGLHALLIGVIGAAFINITKKSD